MPERCQLVVGARERRVRVQDSRADQPPPECPADAVLVIVAGGDAGRRRAQADEENPAGLRRDVGQRIDGAIGQDDGLPVALALSRAKQVWRTRAIAGIALRGRHSDLRLVRLPETSGNVGRLGAGLLDAPPEHLADARQGLGPAPHEHEDEHEDQDDRDVHARMVRPPATTGVVVVAVGQVAFGAPGRSRRRITSLSDVWVSEKATTLLSTSPASMAASMTSTSRSVAARPLRETTQIPPAGRMSLPQGRERLQLPGRIRPKEDQVGLGLRAADGDVVGPLAEQRQEPWLVEPDEGDACPGVTPSLSSSGRV